MLILLQPGIQPLGQLDMADEDINLVTGGEVAYVRELTSSGGHAVDSEIPGPELELKLGEADCNKTDHCVWGLVDEGSSSGLSGHSYGTTFGQVIGATVGQGTGIGDLSSVGTVAVGPSTIRGSGKVTFWTKPGLYGVTEEAWVVGTFDSVTLNGRIYAQADSKPDRGKLVQLGSDGVYIGYALGHSTDRSLVSTPAYYAGSISKKEFVCLYLNGVY